MTLPELSIKRHVLALMLSAVLVLFGFISYERIGMDRFPVHRISRRVDHHHAEGRQPGHRRYQRHQRDREFDQQRARHRTHPVHLLARRVGDQHHLRPGQENRCRLQRGPGQGQPGPAPAAQGRRPARRRQGRDQRHADHVAGVARRPHPAAAQPVRPQHHQEAPGNHRRRRRGAPRRAPRPHHPGQPAAGEDGRHGGHGAGHQRTPSPASTCSWPAASSSARRPKTWSSSTSNSTRSTR